MPSSLVRMSMKKRRKTPLSLVHQAFLQNKIKTIVVSVITVPILTVVMQLPPFLWRQKGTHQSAAIPKCLQQTLSTHHREREVLLALFVFNKPNRQTNYFPVILFTCEHDGKQKCACLDKLQNTFRTTYSLAVSLITPPHTHTHKHSSHALTHT